MGDNNQVRDERVPCTRSTLDGMVVGRGLGIRSDYAVALELIGQAISFA